MRLTKYIAIAGMFIMLACSEEIKVEPFSFPKAFTGEVKKAWSIRNVQFIQAGKTTDTYTLGSCVTDDLYIFYNNPERRIEIREGATVCNAGDPDLIAETSWSFVNATATLMMPMPLLTSAPYEPIPFILKDVDETKLVADIYFQDGSAYRFNFQIANEE